MSNTIRDEPVKHVILGDCLEVMKTFPDNYFSAVITDPPYGTTALAFDQAVIDWPAWWAEIHRVTKKTGVIVCFAADLFTVDLIQSNRANYRYRLVWAKTMPTGFLSANVRPLRCHEDILVFMRRMEGGTYNAQKVAGESRKKTRLTPNVEHYRGGIRQAESVYADRHPTTILHFGSEPVNDRNHPTQKPLDLMEWLVRTYTNPGDKILDPFAGSGSTGSACVKLGREFVGVELDPTYFTVAQKRLRVALAQPILLDALSPMPAPKHCSPSALLLSGSSDTALSNLTDHAILNSDRD